MIEIVTSWREYQKAFDRDYILQYGVDGPKLDCRCGKYGMSVNCPAGTICNDDCRWRIDDLSELIWGEYTLSKGNVFW